VTFLMSVSELKTVSSAFDIAGIFEGHASLSSLPSTNRGCYYPFMLNAIVVKVGQLLAQTHYIHPSDNFDFKGVSLLYLGSTHRPPFLEIGFLSCFGTVSSLRFRLAEGERIVVEFDLF
jgi:hypothetical protein